MAETRKLQMTASEILQMYRQAADRKAQIEILAQLNAVTKDEIRAVLRSCGEDVPEEPKKKPGRPRKDPVPVVEETPEEEGTGEAAEERPKGRQKRAAEPMSAGALAEILARVTEGFPGTAVTLESGTPTGAKLEICWNARGELSWSRLKLLGE